MIMRLFVINSKGFASKTGKICERSDTGREVITKLLMELQPVFHTTSVANRFE